MAIMDKAPFKERVRYWANKLEVKVTSISIRAMKTKWASCSTTGRMTFDTSLLELRHKLQDYVIVHELLHSRVPNHGKLWKSLMHAHLGDYERCEQELQKIAHKKAPQRTLRSNRLKKFVTRRE